MDQPATKSDIQEVLTMVRELSTRVDRLSEKLDATKEQLVNHTNGIAAELHLQIQSAETRLDRENGYRTLWLRTSTDATGDACQ